MRAVWLAAALVVVPALSSCGGAQHGRGRGGAGAGKADVRLTLYRDGAFVEEDVVVDVAAGESGARLPRPAGVDVGDLMIESDDVTVRGWTEVDADGARAIVADVVARAAGPARFTMRYLTDRVSWQASYTLIDDRGRGRLHGALGLDNRTGRSWANARFSVIDRSRPSAPPTAAAFEQRAVAVPGTYAVRPGGQRLDLALHGGALALKPTLVYDPVGTRLDSATMRPQTDEGYGVERWASAVDESLLVDLSHVADGPLPSGPVRVFTVGEGGALVWRGEGRLLPPAADAELYTTVAVGRSPQVTGTRKRTDFAIDHDALRLIEEVTVTLHNAGDRPVDVLVREHLYRGQCWTLAYYSTAVAKKEGAQQIGLGVDVPAGGDATVMYRVLYEWDERTCRLSTSRN
ncbi:MAG TPA: hypothetical protein VM261_00365 [Kofleriaceae bacterium]|nr:hypothetical protein [Kofleriaceae bacterium]